MEVWSHKPGNTPVTRQALTLVQYSNCILVGTNTKTTQNTVVINTYSTENISDPRYMISRIITSEYYSGGIGISLCFKTETTNYSQYVGIFIVD